MKNMTHFKVFDFMINELELKGVQLLVYAYINTACFLHNCLPQKLTYDEIAEELGVSRTAVKRNIALLLKDGLLNETFSREGEEIVSSYTTNRHKPCSFRTHNPYRNLQVEEDLLERW